MNLLGWENVDRSDIYYRACMVATTAAGGAAGIIVGGVSSVPTAGMSFSLVPAGLALGLAAGYLACPYLAPRIKKKLEMGVPLADHDVRPAVEALAAYAGIRNASDAVKLLAIVRAQSPGARLSSRCDNPAFAAQRLLKALA